MNENPNGTFREAVFGDESLLELLQRFVTDYVPDNGARRATLEECEFVWVRAGARAVKIEPTWTCHEVLENKAPWVLHPLPNRTEFHFHLRYRTTYVYLTGG